MFIFDLKHFYNNSVLVIDFFQIFLVASAHISLPQEINLIGWLINMVSDPYSHKFGKLDPLPHLALGSQNRVVGGPWTPKR